MLQHEEESGRRFCMACGHEMDKLQRICEKCGSIMRPARAGGKKNPPERHSSCERCGGEIPFGRNHCDKCSDYIKEREKRHRQEHKKRGFLAALSRRLKRLFSRG